MSHPLIPHLKLLVLDFIISDFKLIHRIPPQPGKGNFCIKQCNICICQTSWNFSDSGPRCPNFPQSKELKTEPQICITHLWF